MIISYLRTNKNASYFIYAFSVLVIAIAVFLPQRSQDVYAQTGCAEPTCPPGYFPFCMRTCDFGWPDGSGCFDNSSCVDCNEIPGGCGEPEPVYSQAYYQNYYQGYYEGYYQSYYQGYYQGYYEGYYQSYYQGYYEGYYEGYYQSYYQGYYEGYYEGYYQSYYQGYYEGGYEGAYEDSYYTGPDLIASYTSPASGSAGGITLTGRVTNQGDTGTGSFTSYFEVQASSTLSWTSPAITLAASANQVVTASRGLGAGSYQVRLCADGAGTITESNEANNCSAWSPLTVTAGAAPDLVASYTSPSSGTEGSITLTGQATNQGTSATGPFASYFEVQGSGTLSGPSAPITLAASASATITASRTFTAAGSPYQVRLCADGYGAVVESNESNNCSSWASLTISPAAGPPSGGTFPTLTL
ncbi:MAG: putative cell adhesion protein, partial [Parcubacteria bacterium C7867-004]